MTYLTQKEEEIMNRFWDNGALFIKELLALYDHPKPHFNTLSTFVRNLEDKGFLTHKAYGNTYQYLPLLSREQYSQQSLHGVVDKYFRQSYLHAVSSLVRTEKISLDELKALIHEVENQHQP
jgi:predicted transcriptional regulator